MCDIQYVSLCVFESSWVGECPESTKPTLQLYAQKQASKPSSVDHTLPKHPAALWTGDRAQKECTARRTNSADISPQGPWMCPFAGSRTQSSNCSMVSSRSVLVPTTSPQKKRQSGQAHSGFDHRLRHATYAR